MPDQQVEPAQHRAVRELVHIVEHEGGRLGQLLCGLDQPQREPLRRGVLQRPRHLRRDRARRASAAWT